MTRWFDVAMGSELSKRCQKVAKRKVQLVEESVKALITNVFSGKCDIDSCWEKAGEAKIDGDVATALGIINSLPGHAVMGVEIQFVSLFLKMVQSYAALRKQWDGIKDKAGKQISADLVGKVLAVRNDAKICRDFTRGQSFGIASLFAPATDLLQKLASGKLNVAWDIRGLPDALDRVDALPAAVVKEWSGDAAELADLVSSWTITDWDIHKDVILDEAHSELVKRMLTNVNYGRCGKGASLLHQWKTWLRSINLDGCGIAVGPEEFGHIDRVVKCATDYCEMNLALHKVINAIPQTRNINLRKNAAAKFIEDGSGGGGGGGDWTGLNGG